MMRGTSTVYYICTVLVGLWALRGDVFANNCPQEQTAARLHILRFQEEEQLNRWKTDNDSLGSLRWRIYTDDLAKLRRQLKLAPDAPVPQIEITRYTADLANMLATQYQNTLQELRSKAKNNKPIYREDHIRLAEITQKYLYHRSVLADLLPHSDFVTLTIRTSDELRARKAIPKNSKLQRLADSLRKKGFYLHLTTDDAIASIASNNLKSVITALWDVYNPMHSTSRYTRHEGVHFKMAKDADKVVPRNSRSNTKKRSRVFAFSGSDSLPPRLSGVDFAALYGKSYFTNEAFAYEYMHAAVVQQTLQLCDLLFELKRDSSPLALDAVRAHLTKEFESPFATKSRNEILTFLQTTIETAIQQSEAEAKVAITFADASITDLKKVLFTKLVDGPEQSNIKIKTDKTLITDRRVELGNGVEVHFSCSQLNAGCKFKDAADFEKQLRALATDEITDIKNLIYQIQARQKLIDQIDHPWISSDHSTPPPKYTPRLENLKRRVNKK